MTSRELTSGFDFWSCGHLRVAVIYHWMSIAYRETHCRRYRICDRVELYSWRRRVWKWSQRFLGRERFSAAYRIWRLILKIGLRDCRNDTNCLGPEHFLAGGNVSRLADKYRRRYWTATTTIRHTCHRTYSLSWRVRQIGGSSSL